MWSSDVHTLALYHNNIDGLVGGLLGGSPVCPDARFLIHREEVTFREFSQSRRSSSSIYTEVTDAKCLREDFARTRD